MNINIYCSRSSDGTISIWDLESKRPIKVFNGDSRKNILQLKRIWGSKVLRLVVDMFTSMIMLQIKCLRREGT